MTSGGNERIPWKTKRLIRNGWHPWTKRKQQRYRRLNVPGMGRRWGNTITKALENYRRQFEELPGEFTR